MICVPLGLYFPSPPQKKSKKVPFENYNVGPETSPSPRAKKKNPSTQAAAASPKASTKKKSGGTPKAVGFFHGSNLGMDGADGGSSMGIPRYGS